MINDKIFEMVDKVKSDHDDILKKEYKIMVNRIIDKLGITVSEDNERILRQILFTSLNQGLNLITVISRELDKRKTNAK